MNNTNNSVQYGLPIGTLLHGEDTSFRVSPYRITRVLGQGGFGITYEAKATIMVQNIPVETSFAIKELFVSDVCHREDDLTTMSYGKGAAQSVETALHGFESEARRLVEICRTCRAEAERTHGTDTVSVNNHNVVPVNEFFKENGTAYFVMEYLDGGSLRDMVRAKGPMDQQSALNLFMPIIEAVDYIHGLRIMHMDIKPENIVMRRGVGARPDVPMLIDFGVSLHFTKRGDLTSRANVGGYTRGFAPIEQAVAVEKFDQRIDVYALGATLFYLLTGHTPIDAFDMTPTYINEQLPPTVSEHVRNAITHAMAKDKVDRTATPKQFLAELMPTSAAAGSDDGPNVTQMIRPAGAKAKQKKPKANPVKAGKRVADEAGRKVADAGNHLAALATKLWKPVAGIAAAGVLVWIVVAFLLPMMQNVGDNTGGTDETIEQVNPADTIVAPQTQEPTMVQSVDEALPTTTPQETTTPKPETAEPRNQVRQEQNEPQRSATPATTTQTPTATPAVTPTNTTPTVTTPAPSKSDDEQALELLNRLRNASDISPDDIRKLNSLAAKASKDVKNKVRAFKRERNIDG